MKYLLLIYENESVAAGMSEADQGKVWGENNGDRGASFHVVLPRADAAP